MLELLEFLYSLNQILRLILKTYEDLSPVPGGGAEVYLNFFENVKNVQIKIER